MSDPTKVSRRLVAVFAADVEGYSRLMGADEAGTFKSLTKRRAILDRFIGDHGGRIANTAGDSVLAEFGSAVDAVQCAVEAQTALAGANASLGPDHRISFRIGVHIGDVMVRAGDLFGDGVNIAARLQTIAKPGGIRKVLPLTFVDLGVQQVKNIREPLRAFQVGAPAGTQKASSARVAEAERPLPLPDKPSIAVLPFQNISGDPEQEYFSDGTVEDIITALSRFKSLFVIARNSSFIYKGKSVDIRQVGRELGVRYVLEGSVRKATGRVRIAAQLIEAATGAHVWADRFDGVLEDVFELQDRIAASIAGAVAPAIEQSEVDRARRTNIGAIDAYDLHLQALAQYYKMTPESFARSVVLFEQALQVDPDFVPALLGALRSLSMRVAQGWAAPSELKSRSLDYTERALRLDKDNAEVLALWVAIDLSSKEQRMNRLPL
jgi:adenylate cyclase